MLIFFIVKNVKTNKNEIYFSNLDGKVEILSKTLNNIQEKLGTNINNNSKTEEHLKNMGERLAIIDKAQTTFNLLNDRVNDLQNILSNKQLRGAFGEVQLENLVRDSLPFNAYEFQKTLSNGNRVDCLINLDYPPGPISIDSKFPLENYRKYIKANNLDMKNKHLKDFRLSVLKHIKDISERYILPGETGEIAIMFLPSESIYAEINIKLEDVILKSREKKVILCGPDNLMLLLNTITGILKNAKMNKVAGKIQDQVNFLLKDLERLRERVGKLKQHFDLAKKDIDDIQISEDKIHNRGLKIYSIDVDDNIIDLENVKKIE